MKKINNQIGFSLVEGLLLVIALALVVGVGYYVYNTNHKDESASGTKTSTSNSKSTSSAQDIFKIKELGVQFKLPAVLKELDYHLGTDGASASFFMDDLDALGNTCEDKGPFAINTWVKGAGTYDNEPGTGLIKQFNDFYIKSVGRGAGRICSNQKVYDLALKYSQALNTASKSVEEIK